MIDVHVCIMKVYRIRGIFYTPFDLMMCISSIKFKTSAILCVCMCLTFTNRIE